MRRLGLLGVLLVGLVAELGLLLAERHRLDGGLVVVEGLCVLVGGAVLVGALLVAAAIDELVEILLDALLYCSTLPAK